MIKFLITGDRIATSCNIMDYRLLCIGHIETIARLSPRFVLGDDGNYIVNVVLNEDGEIEKIENEEKAFARMSIVTPKRLEKLQSEFMEAIKTIVNPQSARDSNAP